MDSLTKLQKFNLAIAAIMFASFVAFVTLSAHRGDPWEVQGVSCYAKWNDTTDPPVIRRACDNAGKIVPIYYTAATVLPSLAASVLAVVYHEKHEEFVQKVGVFRWLDYVLSSSVMVFLIALLNGVTDVSVLAFFVFSQALLICTGPAVEYLDYRGEVLLARLTLGIGGAIHLFIWTMLLIPFYLSVRDGPDWLPLIFVGLFLAFTSFGVVAFLRTETYISRLKSEFYYGILGLAAKIPLMWSIFIAVVVRDSDDSGSTFNMVAGIFAVDLFMALAAIIYVKKMPEERTTRVRG